MLKEKIRRGKRKVRLVPYNDAVKRRLSAPERRADCGDVPGEGLCQKLVVEMAESLCGHRARVGGGALPTSAEHPDANPGGPRSGNRPATPDVVVGWLGSGQGGWPARASASTRRCRDPLTSNDLSHAQASGPG